MGDFDVLHWLLVLVLALFGWLMSPAGVAFIIGWRATRRRGGE